MDKSTPIQGKCQEFYERKLTEQETAELEHLFIKHFGQSDKEFSDFRERVMAVETSFKEANGLMDIIGKKPNHGKGDRRKNKKKFNQHFRK